MFFMNDAEVFTPSIRVELLILFFGILSPFPIAHFKARDNDENGYFVINHTFCFFMKKLFNKVKVPEN